MFYTGKKRKVPEIQMAPLIDCVFLLLIFFMITTVFPKNDGIEIEKPEAVSVRNLSKEHLLFVITKDGQYYYNGQQHQIEEISEIIKKEIAIKPDIAVIVEADKQSLTDNLIKILDKARLSGIKNISIATKPVSELVIKK